MRSFSVLMAVYKNENAEWMKLSIDSVFNQTAKPHEVILLEDGPLTETLYAVIEYEKELHPELKILSFSENRGLGRTLREGLKHCTHDLVARMDTDDVCVPTRFEKQLTCFEENPQLDVCSAWMDEFETDVENVVSVRKTPETNNALYEFGKRRNPVNHPVVMFRKEAVLSNGNYQDFPFFEDYYLWVRMLINGCKFYCIQESLLKFRRSPDMIRRRGGLRYAMTEFRFQCMLYGIRYISFSCCLRNCGIRFLTRIVSNRLRRYIYRQIRMR